MRGKNLKLLTWMLIFIMTFTNSSTVIFAEAMSTESTSAATVETEAGQESMTESATDVPEGFTPIYTKSDLDNVRNALSGKYILMNDLVFTEEDFSEGGAFYNEGNGWTPIATYSNRFTGCFNGNGYTIEGLSIKKTITSTAYFGLFDTIGADGVVQNLTLEKCTYEIDGSLGAPHVGGISGLNYGTIENCSFDGSIQCSSTIHVNTASDINSAYAGGIAGFSGKTGVITNCINRGEINGFSQWSLAYVGGIVGQLYEGSDLSSCVNEGDIKGTSDQRQSYVGGLIGYGKGDNEIANCHNKGRCESNGNAYAGGIIGVATGPVQNCINEGYILAQGGSPYAIAGGIVGGLNSNGSITTCKNIGYIEGPYYAGGIIGQALGGESTPCGDIAYCVNEGTIDSLEYAGGIVGSLYTGTIQSCANTGTVQPNENERDDKFTIFGGIAGSASQHSKIQDSCNLGYIIGRKGCVGGIVGQAEGTISTSYSVGTIVNRNSEFEIAGGITGETASTANILNTYYYDHKSVSGSETEIGLAKEMLTKAESYTGFDFENTWTMNDSAIYYIPVPVGIQLPAFTAENTTEFAGGNGTAMNPYRITNKQHLNQIRNYPGASFSLESDIVFTEADFAEGGDFNNDGNGWKSIGSTMENLFYGEFDGNGYTITGLKQHFNGTESVSTGLFGILSGYVHDLNLEGYDIQVEATGEHQYIGAIASEFGNGLIENCGCVGNLVVTAKDGTAKEILIGGLIGKMTDGNINICRTEGNISTDLEKETSSVLAVGGCIGSGTGQIHAVENTCDIDVQSTQPYTEQKIECGGIAGFFHGAMSSCSNSGDLQVIGHEENENSTDLFLNIHIGGLIGTIIGTITDSFNRGNLLHDFATQKEAGNKDEELGCLGGISGMHETGTVSRCYNTGKLNINLKTAHDAVYLGGIVGTVDKTLTINDAYNLGSFNTEGTQTVSHTVGGILAGQTESTKRYKRTIENVYNLGAIKGNGYGEKEEIVGPVVATITNGFYSGGVGDVHATALTMEQMQQVDNYTGFDFDTVWMMDTDDNSAYPYPQLRNMPMEVQDISVTMQTSLTLGQGRTQTLVPEISEGATSEKIVWSSSDESIATVDQEGKVTGIKGGTATITAKTIYGNQSAECKVRVESWMSNCTISFVEDNFTYTGTSIQPQIIVKNGDTVLVKGKDYTVTYGENIKAGYGWVYVEGCGYYTGEISSNFIIAEAEMPAITVKNYSGTYDGKAHGIELVGVPQGATVYYKQTESGSGSTKNLTFTDSGYYTVYYTVRKANYVTKSGKGSVRISPCDIEDKTIKLEYSSVAYSGKAKEPEVTITGFVEDKDYTVSYDENVYPGTATVTITGIGNCTGEVTKTFTIKAPAVAAQNKVSVELYGYDDIKATWSTQKVSGATVKYKVQYKVYGGSWKTLSSSTTSSSKKKANLSDGKRYCFKVTPFVTVDEKTYYGKSKTSSYVYTLKKISKPKLSKSGTKVKVKWTNISGETGYQISKSTKKTGTNIVATYKTTTGTYKLVSATKNKTYYYKVRAYKTVKIDGETKKVYGPWSEVKSYKRT